MTTKKKERRSTKLIAAAKNKRQASLDLSEELSELISDVLANNDTVARSDIVSVDTVLKELRKDGYMWSRSRLNIYAVHVLGRVSWSEP